VSLETRESSAAPTHASPSSSPAAPPKKPGVSLYVQVLVAIALGVLLGWRAPHVAQAMKPLGDGFVKLIKMLIAPIVFATVAGGIAGMGDLKKVGRVGAKSLLYFEVMTTVALALGMAVVHLVKPGGSMHASAASLDTKELDATLAAPHPKGFVAHLLAMIPDSFVGAFTSGDVLQVLLLGVLTGMALASMGERGKPVLAALERGTKVLFTIVGFVMKAAPIGAFGAMAFTIGKYGLETLINLGQLVATFYITSLLFVLVILGTVARLAGFSILRLIRYLKAELLLVLGTSSSEAALPALMDKMERAGCEKSVVGLVVPTGYSFNLDGTNIYMTLAALFIAQATGVHLSLGEQIALLTVAMVSSKGAAGVTGAGFITLAATLSIVPSVPVAGMALILGVDRFMSECRSLTNFIGNAVATVIVARWEGKLDRDRLAAALAGAPEPLTTPLPAEDSLATPVD
jgi:aerobic C4-dicarboxylate transport protein